MDPVSVDRCPACGGHDLLPFHQQPAIPANSCLLLPDRVTALEYPRGSLELALCGTCGFVGNIRFDPQRTEYSERYEETQSFSPHFTDFARDLAARWVDRYDLHGRTVLEIGCGKGEFLVMMCEAGVARGIGIDPGTRPERISSPAADRIRWITERYSPAHAELEADAVVCRHTLEHIQPVGDFLRSVRCAIGDRLDTVVLFELPDVLRVLRDLAFWDVYYEHCSYFSAGSLVRLFEATGFVVEDVSLDYDDQYLLLEARPAGTRARPGAARHGPDDLADLVAAAGHFADRYQDAVSRWRRHVLDVTDGGGRVVVWGGGSKGVAFLSALDVGDAISYAVDINPYKHGMFMAGTGQEVVSPEFLAGYRPDTVVVMNPVYVDEVAKALAELGISPTVVLV